MKRRSILALFLAVFILFFWGGYSLASSSISNISSLQQTQIKKNTEKITASPKDIKEKTSIYVFMGWMWLSIFILIYFLRQKIKEEDRLFSYKDSP
ncbi:MAG: hypothetical protein ACE5GI_02020 [Candidatus Aminicenantales bacterium]